MHVKKFLYCLIFLSVILFGTKIFSAEYSSQSFKILDSEMSGGGYGTSNSFRLTGSVSEIGIGTSTSVSFGNSGGSLYFPFASTPTVSATAGNALVEMAWTASTGYLGWTASGYNVGQSTVSGGPYSYTSVGNVLASNRTSLTNGTTYYFVVVAKDAFGNPIATSTQVSATPAAPATPVAGGGGGGGGGGGIISSNLTGVVFTGRAYPKSIVTLLKDGQITASTVALDSNFKITVSGIAAGNYNFSIFTEDSKGIRSSPITIPIIVTSGVTTNVSGIFIAPTLAVDKSEVKRGDDIAIFGQSAPSSEIIITVNSDQEFFVKKKADTNGVYLVNFDTSELELGQHSTKSKSSISGEISSYSKTVGFIVGSKNVLASTEKKCPAKGDLNGDCKVNLVDFSIAAFWYKRTLNNTFISSESLKLNGDGKLNLIDFSVMAYYWTG